MYTAFARRRLIRFMYNFKDKTLEQHFGTPKMTFQLDHDELGNILFVTIQYKKQYPFYDIKELPTDVCREIMSYTMDLLEMKLEIDYTNDYPFRAPIWSLIYVNGNLATPVNLLDYYSFLVSNHNNQNDREWTAILDIDKDILNFVEKINHFEYMNGK